MNLITKHKRHSTKEEDECISHNKCPSCKKYKLNEIKRTPLEREVIDYIMECNHCKQQFECICCYDGGFCRVSYVL